MPTVRGALCKSFVLYSILVFWSSVRFTDAECKTWCSRNANEWETKCNWVKSCSSCDECNQLATPLSPPVSANFKCMTRAGNGTFHIAVFGLKGHEDEEYQIFTQFVVHKVQNKDCFSTGSFTFDLRISAYAVDTSKLTKLSTQERLDLQSEIATRQAQAAADEGVDIFLTYDFRPYVLALSVAAESFRIPNINTGVSNPRFFSRERRYGFYVQHSALSFFESTLRAGYMHGLRTVVIIRRTSFFDGKLGGFNADIALSALSQAYESEYTVVGPSLHWCEKHSNVSLTCRVLRGRCQCGEQSQADDVNLGRFGKYKSLDDTPATFYEIDPERAGWIGHGRTWDKNTVTDEREAIFYAIFSDVRSQLGGQDPDLLLIAFDKPWDALSAAASMRPPVVPRMLAMQGPSEFSATAYRQNITSGELGNLVLSEHHGYWILKSAQWHPGLVSNDPIFGSTAAAFAELNSSLGIEMTTNSAALVASGSVLYRSLWRLDMPLEGLAANEWRDKIQMAIGHAWDETVFGLIRFNQFSVNFGQEPISYQTLPNLGDKVVLPYLVADYVFVLKFPSWESRLGCQPGYSNSASRCELCPPGQYSDTISDGLVETHCHTCRTGTGTAPNEFGTIVCKACPAGKFQRESLHRGICANCSSGTFRNFKTQGNRCELCKAGKFSDEGAPECTDCPGGSVAKDGGMSSCEDCQAGFSSNGVGGTVCSLCEVGKFADKARSSSCTDCTFGTTTDGRGSDSSLSCQCGDGSYANNVGCETCPYGMKCTFGSNMSNYDPSSAIELERCADMDALGCFPRLRPSYWSSVDQPVSVYECRSRKSCPGGLPGTCLQHTYSHSCAKCENGFFRVSSSSMCEKCEDGSRAVLPLVLVCLFFAVGLFAYMWNWSSTHGHSRAAGSALASVTVGETLSFMQALGILSRLNFRWPGDFEHVLSFFQAFVLNVRHLRIACIMNESLVVAYITPLCFPLVIVLFLMIWLSISTLLSKVMRRKNKACSLNAILNALGMLLQAFYIAMATSVLKIIECTSNPNNRRTLRFAPYVICFSDDHIPYFVVGVCFFLFYCIGLLTVFARAVVLAPRYYLNQGFARRYHFFFFKFHPCKFWYGLVHMLRALLLATVTIIAPDDSYMQFLTMLFIFVAFLFWHLNDLPYLDRYANNLETLQLCFLIVILGVGSWFIRKPEGHDGTKAAVLTIILYLCVIGCLLAILAVFCWAAVLASNPEKAQAIHQKEVQSLIPSLRACTIILSTIGDDLFRRLLLAASYFDRWHMAEIVNNVGLEICETPSMSWSKARLPRFASNVNFGQSQSVALTTKSGYVAGSYGDLSSITSSRLHKGSSGISDNNRQISDDVSSFRGEVRSNVNNSSSNETSVEDDPSHEAGVNFLSLDVTLATEHLGCVAEDGREEGGNIAPEQTLAENVVSRKGGCVAQEQVLQSHQFTL